MRPLLTIDTKGHCLLCYQVIKTNNSVHCQAALQALLRYLEVDYKRILPFSPNFLSKLEAMEGDFDVKIPTCAQCSTKVSRFHAAYQTFELCRLELESNLQSLHKTMEQGHEDINLAQTYHKRIQPKKPEQLGNAIGATVLRKQTFNKFKGKIQTSQPRVTVSRLEAELSKCPPLLQLQGQGSPAQIPEPEPIVTQQLQQEDVVQMDKVSRPKAKSWACQYCPVTFTQSGNLKYHTFRSHTAEILSPHLPSGYADNPDQIQNGVFQVLHKVDKMSNKKWKCLYCPFSAHEKPTVQVHMMNIHLKRFVNDIKQIHGQNNVKKQGQQTDANPPPVQVSSTIDMPPPEPKKKLPKKHKKVKCVVCLKKISPNGLKSHMRVHDKDNFSCEFCPRKTQRETQLRRHVEDKHLPNRIMQSLPSSYQSENVSYVVNCILENMLSSFVLLSAPEKEYKCPFCTSFVLKPKQHISASHFNLFVHKVKDRLDFERRYDVPFSLDYVPRIDDDDDRCSVFSSVVPTLGPLPVFPMDEVMQAVREHDLGLDDIMSVLNDLD